MGRKPINKERKNNIAKKQEWLRLLLPYFKKNGFLGFSMDDVAAYLSVSKATIYNHFKSKDEIIDLYIEKKVSEMQTVSTEFKLDAASFIDAYGQFLRFLMDIMVDVSPGIRKDLRMNYPEKWAIFDSQLNKTMNRLGEIYRSGIKLNVLRKVNVDLLLLCDRDMLRMISDEDLLRQSKFSPRQVFDDYLQIRKQGVLKN